MPVMKVSWITSPLALAFAQKFLPEQTWVPFFNIIAFVIGTYINAHTKKKRLDALRKKVGGYVAEALMIMLTLSTSIMAMDGALRGGLMTIRDAITKVLIYLRYRRLVLALGVLICVILGLCPRDSYTTGRGPKSLIAVTPTCHFSPSNYLISLHIMQSRFAGKVQVYPRS